MVNDDTVGRICAFLPWGSTDGVPEVFVPGFATGVQLVPPAPRRATIKVRALPDGTPQLLVPVDGGARVIRLGASPARIDIEATGDVIDAVMDVGGGTVILERIGDACVARRVRPDGKASWCVTDNAATSACLLTDSHGRVFVSSYDFLIEANGCPDRLVSSWPQRADAVMHPDGRVGFMRHNPDRDTHRDVRDWVLLDPATGVTSLIKGRDATFLNRAIGMDASGRVYGHDAGSLGRMTPSGHLDWLVELAGVAVSQRHGVTVLSQQGSNGTLLDRDGRVPVDRAVECERLWLAGRREDGGYVLHDFSGYDYGSLLYLDAHGRLVGVEHAGSDAWLTTDVSQQASASSVTPDGEVLIAVTTRSGVYVIGLNQPHRR